MGLDLLWEGLVYSLSNPSPYSGSGSAPRWNCDKCYRQIRGAKRHKECQQCGFLTAHYQAILRRQIPPHVVQCGQCADAKRNCPQCQRSQNHLRRLPYPDARWFYHRQNSAKRQQLAVNYFLKLPVGVRASLIRSYYLRSGRLPPIVDIVPPDEQRQIRAAYGRQSR